MFGGGLRENKQRLGPGFLHPTHRKCAMDGAPEGLVEEKRQRQEQRREYELVYVIFYATFDVMLRLSKYEAV